MRCPAGRFDDLNRRERSASGWWPSKREARESVGDTRRALGELRDYVSALRRRWSLLEARENAHGSVRLIPRLLLAAAGAAVAVQVRPRFRRGQARGRSPQGPWPWCGMIAALLFMSHAPGLPKIEDLVFRRHR